MLCDNYSSFHSDVATKENKAKTCFKKVWPRALKEQVIWLCFKALEVTECCQAFIFNGPLKGDYLLDPVYPSLIISSQAEHCHRLFPLAENGSFKEKSRPAVSQLHVSSKCIWFFKLLYSKKNISHHALCTFALAAAKLTTQSNAFFNSHRVVISKHLQFSMLSITTLHGGACVKTNALCMGRVKG